MFKRKHTEDFDDRSQKKARFNVSEESIEDKLDELIVKIGEKSTSSVEKNIEDLAEIFNIDILPENNRILDVFCECIVEFPQKICIYSTLIGLLNAKNYNFGGNVVEKLVLTLKNFLKNNNYEHARIIVRFLSDLVNTRVIAHAWLINLFENLVNVCNEDEIPQVRSDYFIYMVLSALPWVGKELYEKREHELDQILNTIDKYMRKRGQIKYHSALKVWHSDNPHPQEEYLTSLYNQILKLKSDKWIENHIYRPYLNFDTILCEGLQHNLAPVIPPSHEPSNLYPYPQVVFRLFDYTDCPERSVLPGPNSIERFLFEDILRWIINQNCFDRKDCAIALFNYSNLSISSKVPLEYIIVEVIFGELFALPESKYPEICYGSILLELCKFQPSTFPQVLAQAVELLFDRLDTMNGACVNRFASWFAYHLSNFQFCWKWDDWSVALKYEPLHLKTKFISETLQYCLRLSYHAKVLESVPQTFHKLAPIAPKPKDKYGLAKSEENDEKMNQDDDENKSIKEYAAALTTSLKQKCTPEEALETLDEISNVSYVGDLLKLKIEVFVSCLLNVSSKSMTHTFAFIAKYRDVLKKFNSNEENQLHILDTVFDVWSSHQQLLVILIDKLMKSEVLQCQAVANWIFSKANSEEFMKFYMWEILHATIKRAIRNTKRCAKELEEAKTNLKNLDGNETANTDKTDGDEISPFNALSETVKKLEEKLESSQTEQKNLFLVILHRFIMILTEHIQSCEAQNESFKNYWFLWTISRLQEVFFLYNRFIYKYNETYESLLFTDDLDPNILTIYKQFLYLYS